MIRYKNIYMKENPLKFFIHNYKGFNLGLEVYNTLHFFLFNLLDF